MVLEYHWYHLVPYLYGMAIPLVPDHPEKTLCFCAKIKQFKTHVQKTHVQNKLCKVRKKVSAQQMCPKSI